MVGKRSNSSKKSSEAKPFVSVDWIGGMGTSLVMRKRLAAEKISPFLDERLRGNETALIWPGTMLKLEKGRAGG